jgi:hypothetical protein
VTVGKPAKAGDEEVDALIRMCLMQNCQMAC